MFLELFYGLRTSGVSVTLQEYFAFIRAVEAGVAEYDLDKFYFLARASLCSDERHIDRFDRVFGAWIERAQALKDPLAEVDEEWLRSIGAREFTDEEKEQIRQMGGFAELMKKLQERLKEQGERHEGGSKWIGTGGTSPYGAHGYNPMGVRIGQASSGHRRAVKVWDKRSFRDFDDSVEIGTRQMKMALRRLRKFTREGAQDELDLDGTIARTARNAGFLDIAHRPERKNRVKILLLLDVGGSMDDHVDLVQQLFSAARSEFSQLEVFYFHNCLYEKVWRGNGLDRTGIISTEELMRTYGRDYRVVFVGDASMSPYEITEPGGSVEHWNEVAGSVWMQKILRRWERAAWINPVSEDSWRYTHSIGIIHKLMGGRMMPLTLAGLDDATAELRK
ncbi:MAG: VWA domain-containing protein [Planctomycetota bacterium]